MKRLLLSVAIFLLSLSWLAALSVTDGNPLDSPLASVSYSGRFSDVFSNPAALPLIETETGPFSLSFSWADDYSADSLSLPMPFLQEQSWGVSASFIARYAALTAFFGNEFDRVGEEAVYDIHSSLGIELDMAYAIPHFAFGMRVSGGNRMIRQGKTIDTLGLVFANAWFSPYERESGSESFSVGAGAILYYGPFSGGVYIGELLTLRNEDIYIGWDALAESTTLSLSVGMDRFTEEGDLRFFRPRASLSMTGLSDADGRSIEAEAELAFQFVPGSSAAIGVSYLEKSHSLFRFNPSNGHVGIFLRGEVAGISAVLGVMFRADDFSSFAPSLVISYVS